MSGKGCCTTDGTDFIRCIDCMDEHNPESCERFMRKNGMVMATSDEEGEVKIL